MYDKLSRFRFAIKENTVPEPTGEPTTVLGKLVTPGDQKKEKRYEDIVTDVLTKLGSDEAESRGFKKGEAKHFEYVREFVKRKMERLAKEDMEPGKPAADPNDPMATTTNKEFDEKRRGKKRESDDSDMPAFIKAKNDKDNDEGCKREQDDEPPEDDEPEDDDEPENDDERRKKTEAMIDAVAKGQDPHRIVESLFRR